ncbi:rSAM-modified peptide [[Flexibacter] sp. ATCC 35103]|uniref:rSAM-modified peptide n=1 Tax=[Flexibacter] sp. ATCC 35103 TaxID=1937528 RepID=UPI000F509BA3|nr:rSAM-modified peptide [[Flexibacter] sp. ATCC 35103]
MKNYKLKLQDFENSTLSKSQQKTVRGGDGEEPTKGNGNGNTQETINNTNTNNK